MLRVTQISDPHFSAGTARSHSGRGYDIDRSFQAVLSSIATHALADMVVVTGDVADEGQPSDYEVAAAQLSRLPSPVHVLAGNHDYVAPMEAVLPRPGIALTRSLRHETWLFLFVDSNGGGQVRDRSGRVVDTPERFAARPQLAAAEAGWIHDMVECTDADHVFLWLHHAPGMPGVFADDRYDTDMALLLEDHPSIRGIAGGHVHTDLVTEVADRPVFVTPSLTINVDLAEATALPPGYRTFEFAPDGSIGSTCYLLDGPEWPRTPFGQEGRDYLDGIIDLPAIEGAPARAAHEPSLFDLTPDPSGATAPPDRSSLDLFEAAPSAGSGAPK